ncbi:hypothetical protein ACWGOQ_0010605 [Aquimarina sp. M1]
MTNRYLIVWIIYLSISFCSTGYSQNKHEKEYRIKSSNVPTLALDFMKQGPFDKKIKWYAEESQDGNSIEAKTCYKKRKYSIEFDTDGNPQDIEQKVSFLSVPENVRKQIKSSLDSIFIKSKVKKTQKQWVGTRSTLISLINKKTTTENYKLNYELVIRGKKEKQYRYYELLYNDTGVLLRILKIVSSNTDNLIY